MHEIIEVIFIACTGLMYAQVSGLNPFDFKPFNCVKCMSLWFGFGWYLKTYFPTTINGALPVLDYFGGAILFACACSITALILEKKIRL